MFRHFQISEYTLSRGYLHSIFTGNLSHRDLVHLAPNLVVYYALGKFLESRHGSRKLFYLYFMSSLAGTLAVYMFEKYLVAEDSVKLVVPKCNGSVVAGGLIGAALVRYPFAYFNPLGLKHTMFNEIFMVPLGVIVVFYGLIEYYSWKQGYVEYISREANIAGFMTGMLYGLKYLR